MIDPLSVLDTIETKLGDANNLLATANPNTEGNTAIGFKAKLAPIPAATRPPAAPPLPASCLVNVSNCLWKFLKPCESSLPNIASKVSSP